MVSRPRRFGRQCRTNTWTIHSKNGNSASITSGTSASVSCQSPTMMRAVSAATNIAPIIHGDGCFQNSRPASASVKPFRVGRSVEVVIGCSSRWSIAASSASGGGFEKVVCGCFLRRSGSPAVIASATLAVGRGAADLVGHHRGQRGQRGLVGGAKRVVHQPERDRVGAVDDVVPERQGVALPLDGVVLVGQLLQRVVEQRGQFRAPPPGGQLGDLGPVVKPGFEDAAHDRQVELAGADEQAGEQVESGVAAEVAHGGGVALTHLDQTGRGEPLERLAHRRAGDSEHLGEPALAGQRLSWLHLAAEHLGDDLLEDVLGHRSAVHRLQGHGPSVPATGQRSSGLTSCRAIRW